MQVPIQLIAFDADDTLWHNETLYIEAKSRFFELLRPYATPEQAEAYLENMESRNIHHFGFGIKSFVLSMIETAVEISQGQIPAGDIQQIVALGKVMLPHQMTVLEGVRQALEALSGRYALIVITKGDLLDQEIKLARSGLAEYFQSIEIVSQKNPATYLRILERQQVRPEAFVMVGNSLKSDILPVVEIGARAVYVPYEFTWVHETQVDRDLQPGAYYEIAHIQMLPELIEKLSGGAPT